MRKIKLLLVVTVAIAAASGILAHKAHSFYSNGDLYLRAAGAADCTVRVTTLRAAGNTIYGGYTIEGTYPKPGPCSTLVVVTVYER